ncbi:unnamed protein product [Closterium sp. NIES-53]
MVGVVEPTVSLVPEAGKDFQAVAAAVQANPMVVLPPPDGNKSGLRRHGVERRREACAWIQWGTVACRGSQNNRPASGGREAGPHPRRALRSWRTGEPAICWPAEGERSAAARRWRRDAARRCDQGDARSSTIQRTSPLHRPSPLLDVIVVD